MKNEDYYFFYKPRMTAEEAAEIMAASFGFTLEECKAASAANLDGPKFRGEVGRMSGVIFVTDEK
jgi:hypothetical protein